MPIRPLAQAEEKLVLKVAGSSFIADAADSTHPDAEALVNEMEPGDILLTTGSHSAKLPVHRRVTDGLAAAVQNTPFFHSALYTGGGNMAEMTDDGWRTGQALHRLRNRDFKVVRPLVSDEQKERALTRVQKLTEKNVRDPLKYDYRTGVHALAAKLPWVPKAATTTESAKRIQAGNLICSSIVTHAYSEVPFRAGHQKHLVLPGDIGRSDKVKEVGVFIRKAASHKLDGEQRFRGLDIAVENEKGSTRTWHDPHGKETGSTFMHFAYGYIRLTKGTDGDHVDVYIGPDEDAKDVFIVDQMKKPDFKTFDEQKVMLGFPDAAAAKAAYLKQYDDPGFFGSMKALPFEEFKMKVLDKKNHGTKIAFAVSPGMMSGLQHAGIGGGIGAIAGGIGGAMHADPEHRGQGVMRGALVGAGLGAAGGVGVSALKQQGAKQIASLREGASAAESRAVAAHAHAKDLEQGLWHGGGDVAHAAPPVTHTPSSGGVLSETSEKATGVLGAGPRRAKPAGAPAAAPPAPASGIPLNTRQQEMMTPEAHGWKRTERVQGPDVISELGHVSGPRNPTGQGEHFSPKYRTEAPVAAAPVTTETRISGGGVKAAPPTALPPEMPDDIGVTRNIASTAAGRSGGLNAAADQLEAHQQVLNRGINQGALMGAAAGTGLMGYMAAPQEYGGVNGRSKLALSAAFIREHTVAGLAGRGVSLDGKQQAAIARKAIDYARAQTAARKVVRAATDTAPEVTKTTGPAVRESLKELHAVIDGFKKMAPNTGHAAETAAAHAQAREGVHVPWTVFAPLIAMAGGSVIRGVANMSAEDELVRMRRFANKLEAGRADIENAPSPSNLTRAARGIAIPVGNALAIGGLGFEVGRRLGGSTAAKAGAGVGALTGGLIGYGRHKLDSRAIDKQVARIEKHRKVASEDKEKVEGIANHIDDIGLSILAAPYLAHAAGSGLNMIHRPWAQSAGHFLAGAPNPEHVAGGIAGAMHHSNLREIGGLMAVSPTITKRIAEHIAPHVKSAPQEPVQAAPPTPAALATAEKIGRLLAHGQEKVAINIGGMAASVANTAWKYKKPLAGMAAVGAVGAGLYAGKKAIDKASDMTHPHQAARYTGVQPGMAPPSSV